ncbi:calcium-binding protein CML38-like [Canna indica]|uniref:Calcium-binding protein CML38-like n=1 Tax=Canna indica TaxID=4628 RepID=A0AAQ3JQA6_9LILI|nr:calcium-binding protein CML38-like [Canna indica]
MAFMHSHVLLAQKEMSAGEFRAWLRQFDADGDGRISREDLQRAIHSLHAWFAWWKARQAMKAADVNRNGVIEEAEMSRLIAYANQHLHMKIYEYDSAS